MTPILITAAIMWGLCGVYAWIAGLPIQLVTIVKDPIVAKLRGLDPAQARSFAGGVMLLLAQLWVLSVHLVLGPLGLLTPKFPAKKEPSDV